MENQSYTKIQVQCNEKGYGITICPYCGKKIDWKTLKNNVK